MSTFEGGEAIDSPDVFPTPLPPPLRDKPPLTAARMVGKARMPRPRKRPGRSGIDASAEQLAAVVRDAGIYGLASLGSQHASLRSRVKLQTRLVRRTLRLLYPGRVFDPGTISRLIWEAHASTDDNYGEEEALRWAEGYEFPPDIGSRDSDGLRMAHGNLSQYCRARHEAMSAAGRLSRDSIGKFIDPED